MPFSGHNLGCSLHFPVLRFHADHPKIWCPKKCHLPFISSVASFNSKQKDPPFNHYFENTYITEPLLSHYNLRAKSTTTVNPIRSSVHDYYWGAGHFWRKKNHISDKFIIHFNISQRYHNVPSVSYLSLNSDLLISLCTQNITFPLL